MASWAPQHLANTVWSFATLGLADAPILTSIASASRRTIGEFGPQGLANTVWAYAKLAVLDAPLLDAISAAAIAIIS